ncbi:MAG: hypothetical protein GPJ54_01890 [Candidatus Heimdallarchaeota archaeon]|nr:hypothetical protein [Candidatus Heimdallarchaeota archaeon]
MVNEKNKIIISNQTSVLILLHFKNNPDKEFGTRETQRILGMNSSSTVSLHINKLADLGLIEKSPSDRYYITQEGIEFDSISFPMMITADYVWGKFVPKNSYLLGLLLSGIVICMILLILNIHIAIILTISITVLLIALALVLNEWLYFRNKYQEFITLDERKMK